MGTGGGRKGREQIRKEKGGGGEEEGGGLILTRRRKPWTAGRTRAPSRGDRALAEAGHDGHTAGEDERERRLIE
jgi:hypothetical protein